MLGWVFGIGIYSMLLTLKFSYQFRRYKGGPIQSQNGSCNSCSKLEERISGSLHFWWFSWFLYLQERLVTKWNAHNLLSLNVPTDYLFIAFCFLFLVGRFDPEACRGCGEWWYSLPYISMALQGMLSSHYLGWLFCLSCFFA